MEKCAKCGCDKNEYQPFIESKRGAVCIDCAHKEIELQDTITHNYRVINEGINSDYTYYLCYCTKEEITEKAGKPCEATFIGNTAYFCSLDIPVLAHESLHVAIEALRVMMEDINFNEMLLHQDLSARNAGEECFAYSYSEVFAEVCKWAEMVKGNNG